MSRPGDKFINLSGKILGETAKAIRFSVEGVAGKRLGQSQYRTVWLPLSQVNSIVHQPPHSTEDDTLKVSEWIWKQKIEDSWSGQDPRNFGSSPTDEELGLDEDEYDQYVDEEEGPPF